MGRRQFARGRAVKPLEATASSPGAEQRKGISLSWSPNLLVPAGLLVLIAVFGLYLAQPRNPDSRPWTVSIRVPFTGGPPTVSTKRTISANEPKSQKNATGSTATTRHAVYGTPSANNPAANYFGSSSPAPAGVNVASHLVRTTRVDTKSPAPAPAPPPAPLSKQFTITNDTEVVGQASDAMNADSTADCEQKCAKSPSGCNLFAFNKETQQCFLYTSGELRKNPLFDFGVRTMRGIHVEAVRPDFGGLRMVPLQQQK